MTPPSPIALIVCDNVYRESSGKTALVGLFSQIAAPKFPAHHPRLCVYACVTDIRPNTKLKLEIVNAETDHCVVTMEGPPPTETTPLTICDMNFDLRNLVFPEPGMYFIRFWGNDSMLLQRPFEVVKIEPEAKK